MRSWAAVVVLSAVCACQPAVRGSATVVVDTDHAVADGTDEVLVTVSDLDLAGNGVSGLNATLQVSGDGVTFTPTQVLTNAAGVAHFHLTSTSVGDKQITALVSDVQLIAQPVVTFTPAPATHLAFHTQPTSVTAGQPLPTVEVSVLDALDRPALGATAVNLTAADAFTGPARANSVAGVATFEGLVFVKAGTGLQLEATLESGAKRASEPFDVLAAAPNTLSVTVDPLSTPARAGDLVPLTVIPRDQFQNPVPNVAVSVTCGPDGQLMPASGVTDATGAFVTTCRSSTLGTKTVTASAASLTAQTTFEVRTGLPDAASTVLASPSSLAADGRDTATVTVTLRDAFGHPVTDELVTLTSAGSPTIFPPSRTTDLGGVATFLVRSTVPGVITLHASTRSGPLLAAPTLSFTQPTFHLVAYVQGLANADLVLSSTGQPDLTIAAGAERGEFTTPLTVGQPYAVTVKAQPTGLVCRVFGGTGVAQASNAFVRVTCGTPWKAVADGLSTVVGVRADGSLWQLDEALTFSRVATAPVLLDASTDWDQVATIATLSGGVAGLRTDHTLWGKVPFVDAAFVQLGVDADWGTIVSGAALVAQKLDGTLWWVDPLAAPGGVPAWTHEAPERVGSATDRWTSFSMGDENFGVGFGAAVNANGTLWLWDHLVPTPVQLGVDQDWAAVSAGNQHLLALKHDGSLWWARVTSVSTATTLQPVAAPVTAATGWSKIVAHRFTQFYTAELDILTRADGSLWTFDVSVLGTAIAQPWNADGDWAIIDQFSALKRDGSRWSWARDHQSPYFHAIARGPVAPSVFPSNHGFSVIAAADFQSSAIAFDGTLSWWGAATTYAPTPVTPAGPRVATAISGAGAVAISTDGTLMTSAPPAFGTFTTSTPGSWVSATIGATASAIRSDATLWSITTATELNPGTRWKAIATDALGHFGALNADGSLWNGGEGSPLTPTNMGTDWVGVVPMGAGGIRADGTLWVGGLQSGTDTDWVAGFAESGSLFGIKRDGSLWLSDANGVWGRLGTGTGWTSVATGARHTLGLRADGSMWVWGDDGHGQLGDGLPLNGYRFAP